MVPARFIAATFVLALSAYGNASAPQDSPTPLPILPERYDTILVSVGDSILGREIVVWTRLGLEQLQVRKWTSAVEGASETDSLFANPMTLVPVREVRVTGDTVINIIFGGDTLFLTTIIDGSSSTSRALAPVGAMYSSSSLATLAATMPLRPEANRTFLVFLLPPFQRGAISVFVRVWDPVRVDGREAWRVTASTPGGGSTYWVDAVTRTILRSEIRIGDTVVSRRPINPGRR